MTKKHWTEKVEPDGPEMAALRKARLANPLMAAGMAKVAAQREASIEDEYTPPDYGDEGGDNA